MNRKNVRSRSNSPSSSVDSTYRRKLGKKPLNSVKSKEDVQVFTSLPPKVEGEIKCYLKLQITKISFINETPTNDRPLNVVNKQNKNTKITGREINLPNKIKNGNLIARCVWWGEENTTGAIFRPKLIGSNSLDNKNTQTTAKYMVRSGPKQFSAYLNDMKTLDIDLIDSESKDLMGKVQVFEIPQLTPSNPIKGYYAAFDSNQVKIADVYVSIQFESLQKNLKKASESENSRPVTPTSAANINDFNTKYEQFEKKQLELAKKLPSQEKTLVPVQSNTNSFNSNSYVNTLNEDMIENSKNPIIQNLIDRGLKLKQQMSKSTLYTDKNNFDSATLYSLNKNDFLDDLIEDNLNDVSRLSDPLNDPDILSALIFTNNSPSLKNNSIVEDEDLKNLLDPPDLFNRLIEKKYDLPIETGKNVSLIHRSNSRCSISSNDDDESNFRNNPRVSFEIQSSDAEGSICNDRCIDILSPQRISLLNLIQISRISIEKLHFFQSCSIQSLLERLNKVRDPSPSHQLGTKSTTFKSKPPLAVKKFDLNQLFYIEYQFPVMGNLLEESVTPMSSQIMRVISKKFNKKENTDECSISFEHTADYSVLFNSHSLESWWRSYVSFKVFVRPPVNSNNSKNTISSNSLSLGPQLIGLARLSLRNVLKSKNFKLLKRLAVNDPSGKRIGTLNVSLELSSDLEEFLINLKKLKNSEKFEIVKKTNKNERTNEPVLTIQPYEPKIIHEPEVPIQMFLSINEGRGFIPDFDDPEKIYLISRLFWNKEKIKFDASKNFNWTLNLSFMLKKSIIENMKNNFMIIEAWKKDFNTSDSLIGTIKIPLHEFYLKTYDLLGLKEFLKDGSKLPLIGVDDWLSVFDLFTGQKVGEINVLNALGSHEQIMNIQKILFDKKKSDKLNKKSALEHHFIFNVDDLKIHPVRTGNQGDILLDSEFFIKYKFPSTPLSEDLPSTTIFNSYTLSTKMNSKFNYKHEHKIVLPSEISIRSELVKLFETQPNFCVNFEIWSKSNYSNSKEKLIGKGELSMEKMLSIIKNSSLDVNNRSFIIPLVNLEEEKCVRFSDVKNDRYIGQLLITIEYKRGKIVENLSIIPRHLNDPNEIQLSVGVLRADGLRPALIKSSNGMPNLENSNIYVKFSLSFLNRPYDYKQTRLISSSLSRYSPEFFDYFDIFCPLISKYNSSSKRTVSLAEQIELGQIIFEVWAKYSDIYYKNSSDILLGKCIVDLEPLLENRIGVRGWMPIKSVSESMEPEIGSLEIAIRFVKSDDYLKIIENGKEIGWKKSSDFIIKNNSNLETTSIPIIKESTRNEILINDIPSNPQVTHEKKVEILNQNKKSDSHKKVKCLIEIEKAIHLPKVFDEKLSKNFEPDSFVTFNTNTENLSETAQTKICEQNSSPIWNYQLLFHMDSDYFIDESKYFILKVWHKNPEANGLNKLLGCVSVDLQPLMCGLTHLSGWYNIQDSIGNSQGQLKVNILPQENLFEIKEAYLKRKKNRSENTNKNTSFYNLKFEQSVSQTSISQQTCSAQSTYTINSFRSESVLSNEKENNIQEILKDKNELKLGLIEKLSELDKLNKMLRERLEKKNLDDQVKKIDTFDENVKIVQTQPDPCVIKNRNLNQDKIADYVQNETQNFQNNESYESEERINDAIPVKTLLDSFWAESVGSDAKSEKSVQYDMVNSIDSDKIKHLPPIHPVDNENTDNEEDFIKSNESNHDENDLDDQKKENLYDTDLDQTCNLNASYEIIPNRQINNQSPQIETYDFVDKIIDCNKLGSDDEHSQVDELNKLDNNKSILMNEIKNYEDDFEESEENENLTVIIPEELNKVSKETKEIESEQINDAHTKEEEEINEEIENQDKPNHGDDSKCEENNKTDESLHSKIPNYFLPKEDLEKTMKRLHYNYVNMTQNHHQETESETEENDNQHNVKIKVKSTTLLIQNKSLLKKDLSRINKIFHSKFNE
ncbi:unnamed protein product [Brachionus calyciflorus]|uniref:C2 domain-containing protein n=1 Tax=Brachionus calyciflorus TaxID=104777 RepID=A0A813MEC6_9BILA|nr:unnamed protein product [Brachionus calyciflorus]